MISGGSTELKDVAVESDEFNPELESLRGSKQIDGDNEPDFLVFRRLHLSKAKLKGVTEMAALMAGFSVVATVELQINPNTSEALLTCFAITTSLLVSCTMLAIMIATCLLPHLEAVSKMDSAQLIKSSPHEALISYIDVSWVLANTFSIFLFIVDVVLLCWIKFHDRTEVCIVFTAIMIPVLILLIVFSLIFYRSSVNHQYAMANKKYLDLLDMLNKMTNPPPPIPSNNNSRAHSLQSLHLHRV